MFAFVKRVCVGVGAEVLVKIDGAEVDPVKLWCIFARAREVTNFLPPCLEQIEDKTSNEEPHRITRNKPVNFWEVQYLKCIYHIVKSSNDSLQKQHCLAGWLVKSEIWDESGWDTNLKHFCGTVSLKPLCLFWSMVITTVSMCKRKRKYSINTLAIPVLLHF